MKYTIIIASKSVEKQYLKLPKDIKPIIINTIFSLEDEPRPQKAKKL